MLKEISQEDFYWRSAGEFQDAVGGLKLYCSTKTPCVLSKLSGLPKRPFGQCETDKVSLRPHD